MNIVPGVTVDEVLRSSSHPELAADLSTLPADVAIRLTRLSCLFLRPIREKIGRIRITSGYRSPDLNRAISDSSKVSRHCTGGAVDFVPMDKTGVDAWRMMIGTKDLMFDRLAFYTKEGNRFHVDLGDFEDGEELKRSLFFASPKWRRVTVEEAMTWEP